MTSPARRAVQTVQDAVRSQLWPLPILGVALAVALGILVPLLDVTADDQLPAALDALIFNGDPGAARTVLSAVASSLITVTSLTFSLTVVTLQLASSQFSPRLLRTFTQDLFVQATLSIFLATFTFSLTVLRSVRSAEEGGTAFVPRLAVTMAFLLALTSVVSLVLFLAHLARQIRVETMLLQVHDDAVGTMKTNLIRRHDPDAARPVPEQPTTATVLLASGSGFLTSLDQEKLVKTATDTDTIVSIDRDPGSFVVQGTPLGHIWPRDNRPLDPEDIDRLRDRVTAAVHLGPERTAAQDVAYGLRQITDIVNRALSPGINDPTTAIHGLGQTASLLAKLTAYHLGPLVVDDPDGDPRVLLHRPGFPELLELAIAQPRAYGKSDPQVLGRLYQLLADLTWHVHDDQRGPVLDHIRRLDETVADQDFDEAEKQQLAELSRSVRQGLSEHKQRAELRQGGR
ncbi:DUF2254 domain-containing protein [Pseudactinotalea terrae]|uniref:DUF2254 domain-containing protein n=1 Tax=Pseudactinotalea terrae TaxID=1743262 RepID=UPI0019D62BB1|nr:DUF2254 domain-containing protein [Pseudactinotalea terrae]